MDTTNQKLGKYTLVRHIATGGMAEIWLGEQEGPGGFSKQLVIKRILSHLARDEKFTRMFLDEARTVAQLTHPNIGQIFELGEIDGSYFIAMEYIEGMDLSDLVSKAGQRGEFVPLGIAVKLVVDMLLALEFAHNFHDRDGTHLGLVHRDVTPHNVLVSNDGVVKLVDFGVAKAKANQSKTQTGAVKGKFAYMAPEQIESGEVDRRVDVFAAGIVLYEVLTGHKPFGDDLFAVNAILTQPMPDPREHRPDIPQTLVNILSLALAKKRDERYQSAQTLMRDLEDYMSASGTYVSQRDISNYVRGLQGLAPSSTGRIELDAGPRAKITEREQALAPAHTPQPAPVMSTFGADLPVEQPKARAQRTETAVGVDQPKAPVALAKPTPQSPPKPKIAAPQEDEPITPPKKGRSTLMLVLVALGIFGGIVLAGGGVVVLIAGANSSPRPQLLRHQDQAKPVTIDATSPAKIYYKEQYISPTPFKTTLKPGTYTLEARDEKVRKVFKITVKNTSEAQSFTAKM